MVENVEVNVGAPNAGDFARGLIDGVSDTFDDLIQKVRDGSNEFFMVATISVMLIVGGVTIWRKL
jgi:hypothetical protein